MDKDTGQCPQTTTFEEKGEPERYRTEVLTAYQPTALPLGHTGSPKISDLARHFSNRCNICEVAKMVRGNRLDNHRNRSDTLPFIDTTTYYLELY